MKAVLGIDVGGSTTKIVGFDENKNLIEPMFVHGSDQITSIYGAFGKFISENGLSLEDVKGIKVTGVGATFLEKGIYSLKCDKVSEFNSKAEADSISRVLTRHSLPRSEREVPAYMPTRTEISSTSAVRVSAAARLWDFRGFCSVWRI